MKPVVLPGEVMKVFILKEGKEYNQGVAYLDDGTMVVVDNARKMISKTIDIVVTSVLQTTAGKMIFGRHIEAGRRAAGAGARPRRRAGAGRGPRRRRRRRPAAVVKIPSFHWWRTVFFLIPAIGAYTIVLGTVSIAVEPVRPARAGSPTPAPAVWSRLILVTTGVRVRVRGPRALEPGTTYVFVVEPPEHLRHPGHLLVAAVPAAHHRQGVAGIVPVPRVAPAPDGPPAGRSPQPGSRRRSCAAGANSSCNGPVAHHLPGRHAERRRPRRRGSRPGQLHAGDRGRAAGRAAVDRRHAARDARRDASPSSPGTSTLAVHPPIDAARRAEHPSIDDARTPGGGRARRSSAAASRPSSAPRGTWTSA